MAFGPIRVMPTNTPLDLTQVLQNPGCSYWLKNAITESLKRDPVDAAADAEVLALLLTNRCTALFDQKRQNQQTPTTSPC